MVTTNEDVKELPALCSKAQVAEWLGCTPRHIELQVKAKAFPSPIHTGNRPRWRRSDLLNWLEEQSAVA